MRRILYVTGTRADFGLMLRTLKLIDSSSRLELEVAVTGTHLSPKYGDTIQDIENSGLHVCTRIKVPVETTTGHEMAVAIGQIVSGMADVLAQRQPDVVLLLGDRGEMLAAAIAALYQSIPIAHIHGGERSGTVDEPVRHAISKLSHYHFVATAQSRDRLIRMGECTDNVFVTGAPGLDGITERQPPSRDQWCGQLGFNPKLPVGLFVYHPVVQEAGAAADQVLATLQGGLDSGLQLLVFMPNSDAGGDAIRHALKGYDGHECVRILTHLQRDDYLSAMSIADVMLGNSSSGIVEAASFNLPVVNVGSRQNERERSENVLDAPADKSAVRDAIQTVLVGKRGPWANVYGDGKAGEKITRLLEELPLDTRLLAKTNAY